jgi:NAD(P)-dependent dehydrogenase (short-subunit alcohol dehydrogenase family)
MARFDGKVAVVTGAGGGIGLVTATALAREGAAVALVDIRQDLLDSAARDLLQQGRRVCVVHADVSRAEDARRIAEETVTAFNGIDILVNNAAIELYGTVVDMPEEEWDRVLAVNLRGVYLVARYCIPAIARRGGGAVVNVASVQAFA